MASRAAVPLEGVVLTVHNAGEAHRVVHLFDHQLGRVGLWARHARGSKRRLAGVLEPFATVRATAGAQGALYNLHAAEVVRVREGIRAELPRIARAANLCTLVRSAWPEQQAAPEVLAGLEVALDHLHHGRVARAAGLYPRLAQLAGLLPDLRRCARCGAPLPPLVPARHEPACYCPRCAAAPHEALSDAAVAGLQGARLEDAAAADAVERAVMGWFGAHLGKPLVPWGQAR